MTGAGDAEAGAPRKAPGMRHPPSEQQGDLGVLDAQQSVMRRLGWIFREQTKADKGIDAHVEVVAADDPLATGRLLALQIKSGDSFFRDHTDDGWWFRSDTAHLRYWLSHSLPVLIVLVDTDGNVFWEHLTAGAYEETPAGFKMEITQSRRLDETSRAALVEIAGRADENLQLKTDTYYALLPSDTVRALKRAFSTDPMRAARVAGHLAAGRTNARSAATALTGTSPTWIVDSPAQQDLWLAAASYAYDHGEEDVASTAFSLAAGAGGAGSARALAYAALTAYPADADQARALADRAVAEGGGILADAARAILALPRDSANVVPVPESIRLASEAELDAEPTVRNFLGELAVRNGDLGEGVRQRRAAVAAGGPNSHGMQLVLAQTLLRRSLGDGLGHGADIRDALDAARAALAEQRRFAGPSHKALETLLDIYTAVAELDEAIEAALPAAAGGTALDAEAETEGVARRGAMAALARGNHHAAEQFLALLPDGPAAREMRALADSANGGLERDEEVALWEGLLAEADSDPMLARCSMHLAGLGSWPARVEELRARKILPDVEYDILVAVYDHASGNEPGLDTLKKLAQRTPRASLALVEQARDRGDLDRAIEICREQVDRWDDAALNVLLADLLREAGRDDEAADHITVQMRNARLPVPLRLSLARWLFQHQHKTRDFDAAVGTARAALLEGPDDELAWNLVATLEQLGRYEAARQELARWEPAPQTDAEARLWMQLHLGVPATPADAATMARLARGRPPGQLRDAIVSILRREHTALVADGALPGDGPLADEIALLASETPHPVPEDETAGALTGRLAPAAFAGLLPRAAAGTVPWADVAAAAEQPYTVVLTRRPGGVLVSHDLSAPLRNAGERAAAAALDGDGCVADLSALYLLSLLPADTAGRLLSASGPVLPSGAARDIARAVDGLRSERLAGTALVSGADGILRRETLPAAQSRQWQQIADRMRQHGADAPTKIGTAGDERPADPTEEALALAAATGQPVWADDAALRQRARARGLASFSLLDLAAVLAARAPGTDPRDIRLALAPHGIADLPLDCDDLADLATRHGWSSGPVPATLVRQQWWDAADDWRTAWLCLAQRARLDSAESLTAATRAALQGALPAAGAALATQRHQELAVTALVACHEVDLPAPPGFLDAIARHVTAPHVPKPGYVLKALVTTLEQQGTNDAVAAATTLLPGVDLLP